MANNYTTVSKKGIEYLCGLINQLANVSEGIDDLNLRTDGTFSSVKIDTLLNILKTDCNEYTDRLVANLSILELKIATSESEITQPNTMYLYKPSGAANYEQYVVIEGTKVLLGTTDINMGDYYTISQTDAKFVLKTDFDSLKTTVDKKVDKTDIVDNLTSADIDKPLSANQGKVLKDEVDLKANDSDVVKKTDIVTTIDNTSTDDTIPSTKAVYDKINPIVIKSISTSYDSDTIENYLETITPNTDVLFVSNSTTGELVTLTGQHLFLIEYREVENLFLQRAYQARDGKLIACRSKNWWSNTWSSWQRVCTTSVSDTSQKVVSLSDVTNYKTTGTDWINYEIYNGVCYLRILIRCVLPPSYYVYLGDVPKPRYTKAINCNGWGADNKGDSVSGTITSEGKLGLRNGTSGGLYLGTLSYPVAES